MRIGEFLESKKFENIHIYLKYFLRSLEAIFLSTVFISISFYIKKINIFQAMNWIPFDINFFLYSNVIIIRTFIIIYIFTETLTMSKKIFKANFTVYLFLFLNSFFFLILFSALSTISFFEKLYNF